MPVLIAAIACIVLVFAQDAVPAQPWFHQGSYASVLIFLTAWQWWAVRRYWNYALALAGASIIVAAGLGSSLLGPDVQTIVRGPGESVPLTEPAGVLAFPLSRPLGAPLLQRSGRRDVAIDPHGRRTYLAAYILWAQPRTAAYVQVFDSHGARLTITQPTNTSFLSPVLLFGSTTPIGGKDLPVDSFAVPAAHRSVKAVLFSSADVSRMGRLSNDPRPAVLFAVEDERGQIVPGAIGLARNGESISEGGLTLRASIEPFPSVVIAPAPYLPLALLGLLVFGLGLFRSRSR